MPPFFPLDQAAATDHEEQRGDSGCFQDVVEQARRQEPDRRACDRGPGCRPAPCRLDAARKGQAAQCQIGDDSNSAGFKQQHQVLVEHPPRYSAVIGKHPPVHSLKEIAVGQQFFAEIIRQMQIAHLQPLAEGTAADGKFDRPSEPLPPFEGSKTLGREGDIDVVPSAGQVDRPAAAVVGIKQNLVAGRDLQRHGASGRPRPQVKVKIPGLRGCNLLPNKKR